MVILLTGATGLVGQELGLKLFRSGHELIVITRQSEKARLKLPFPCTLIEADLTHQASSDVRLQKVEAVINLVGESIGDSRWSTERKKRIYDSRILSTRHLIESLQNSSRLKVFIGTSASGFYGDCGDEVVNEESSRGSGFLSDVCVDWEREIQKAQKQKTLQARTVIFRLGVVFDSFGGAFRKILQPFDLGFGAPLGSGQQWVSWIHIADLVRMYEFALNTPTVEGIVNTSTNNPVTNRVLTSCIAKNLDSKVKAAVPGFMLKLLLGEQATLVLSSTKMKVQKWLDWGFEFKFPDIESAVKNLLEPYREGHFIFHTKQYLPHSLSKVFSFYSEAKNLEKITPPLLQFHVENMSTNEIQKDTVIRYRLKIHGVPLRWQTLITDWQPNKQFIDVQKKGPYQLWHHTHQFESLGPGTLMTDTVKYKIPMMWFGRILDPLWIRRDVESIFDFRRKSVPQYLNDEK